MTSNRRRQLKMRVLISSTRPARQADGSSSVEIRNSAGGVKHIPALLSPAASTHHSSNECDGESFDRGNNSW